MKKNIIYLLIAIVILVLAVLTWQYVKQSSNNQKEKSIVVLPFSNDSTNENDEYLVDGLMNGIIGNLGKVSELKVISKTTADHFKDSDKSPNEIAEELRVNYVLMGRFKKQDDKVRIDVQLIDAKNMKHIYAERFLRDTGIVYDIATEISQEVKRNLQ